MSVESDLHIIAPGICGPLADIESLHKSRVVVDWVRRLSIAARQKSSVSLYGVIEEIFGLNVASDFPAAVFELSATGDNEPDLHYMCADPVHLQADMDHAILSRSEDVSITEDESVELCGLLDRHFSQDGIRFIYRNRFRWLISSESEIVLSTTPMADAVGRNVNFLLPAGEGASHWKQVLTEAQMLLFSSEINSQREGRGLPAINSVWLYGSGKLPESQSCEVDLVTATDDLLKGVASFMRCGYSELPGSAADYIRGTLCEDDGADGCRVLYLSDLDQLTDYTDVSHWLDRLGKVLDEWIYPLLTAAAEKGISVHLYPCNGRRYRFSKYDGLRFWRRDEIETHISCY